MTHEEFYETIAEYIYLIRVLSSVGKLYFYVVSIGLLYVLFTGYFYLFYIFYAKKRGLYGNNNTIRQAQTNFKFIVSCVKDTLVYMIFGVICVFTFPLWIVPFIVNEILYFFVYKIIPIFSRTKDFTNHVLEPPPESTTTD